VHFVRLATKTKKVHEIFIVNRLTNVSQGSVETYARSGGVFNKYSTTNLPKNLAVTKVENRLRFDSYGHEFVALLFGPSYMPE